MINYNIKECKICSKEYKKLGLHVMGVHKISMEDYYNLYINTTANRLCRNENCKEELKFINLSKGYREFCSTSCASKYNHCQPEFKKVQLIRSSNTMSKLHSDEEFSSRHSDRNKLRVNEFTLKSYLTKSKDVELAVFYIMRYDEFIKIGICHFTKDLIHFNKRLNQLRPNNYEVYVGKLIEIANYEYLVKESYIPIKEKEYFNLDLYDEIKSKIPNTILPYSTLVV